MIAVVLAASAWSGSATVRGLAGGGCASADTPHVGLVIDFGTVTGAGTRPAPQVQTACVALAPGAYGDTVLHDAGLSIRYGPGGFICALDGYPASGCGTNTASGYEYWSYWHGGSSWTYSTVGPGSYRPAAGSVEGLHFVQGQDSASEAPPGFPSSGPCPAPTPSTTAASTPTTAPSGGHPSGSGGLPGAGSTSSVAPGRPGSASATTIASTAARSGSTPASPSASRSTAAKADAAHRSDALPSHGEIVARSGRGSPVGPILVVMVIVGLVVASVLIRRRRTST